MEQHGNAHLFESVQLPQPGAPLSVLDQADLNLLKGQCHAIVNPFFCSKDSAWAPYEEAKTMSQTFCIFMKQVQNSRGIVQSTTVLYIYTEFQC